LYRNADWERIKRKILDKIGDGSVLSRIVEPELLDFAASSFTDQVEAVLEEGVPRAKASPYAKRWWTKELSMLRDDLTMELNRVTNMRRQGEDVTEAIRATQTTRRLYHDEINRQKKQHWKDFLNDPENIWKAARYAKGANATASIPDLKDGENEYCTDEEKAGVLMSTFFPKQPDLVEVGVRSRQHSAQRENPTWPLLTKHEVERAIFQEQSG